MCLGHTHALSGLVTGLAAGLYGAHALGPSAIHLAGLPAAPLPPAQLALFTGLTAGAAVLPDIDHPNSSLAHSFGFLTKGFAWLVGRISGGHRHLTHAVLGVAGFTGLAWLAVRYRQDVGGKIGLAVLLALIIASGLYALRVDGHGADLLAILGAIEMTLTGTGLPLVALAVLVGSATHVVGDMLTDQGCPLLYPFSEYHFRLLPDPLAFTTGTRPELWILDPALVGGLGYLIYRAALLGGIKIKF
ncbi:MAG TPA: metal-dependent hydrolase [Streptosporangiaceae bacterium]|nr:metal-dependent hydrolase [Streptosporangiaceae bacterium]